MGKLISFSGIDGAGKSTQIKILKESIKVSAESGTSGSQETSVDAKIEGPEKDFEIAFNYRFLENVLQVVEGSDINMKFSTPDAPGVFLDSANEKFLHLIMPVKLNS